MRYALVEGLQNEVAAWVADGVGGCWVPGMGTSLGVVRLEDTTLVAAATFTQYNHHNAFIDLRIEDPAATRLLFKAIGAYAFGQLGVRRLTLATEAANLKAQDLHRRLGATLEARLKDAAGEGNDILISRLTPDCVLWRRWNGRQSVNPSSTRLH